MNVIKQIISDIKHLKNIENYVIILSAAILIMTDIFGEPNSDWLTEATLGVLALLAIDRIQSKRLLENVNLSLQDVRRGHYFEKSNEVETQEVKKRMESMSTIDWLTFTNRKTISTYGESLKKMLNKGGKIRILLVSPQGNIPKLLSLSRFISEKDPEDYLTNDVNLTIRICSKLQRECPNGKIELRYLKGLPPYRITIYNKELGDGYMRIHFLKTDKTISAMTVGWYQKEDEVSFSFFAREYDNIWNDGIPVDLLKVEVT